LSAHGLEIFRRLIGIDFVSCDVVEVIPGYDPGGLIPMFAASVACEVVSLVVLRRLKCEMEAR
jgi:agmatinase